MDTSIISALNASRNYGDFLGLIAKDAAKTLDVCEVVRVMENGTVSLAIAGEGTINMQRGGSDLVRALVAPDHTAKLVMTKRFNGIEKFLSAIREGSLGKTCGRAAGAFIGTPSSTELAVVGFNPENVMRLGRIDLTGSLSTTCMFDDNDDAFARIWVTQTTTQRRDVIWDK